MTIFTDRFGLVHDRPTDGYYASSGNPAIYTAIYETLADIAIAPYSYVFTKSIIQKDGDGYQYLIRHPDKPNVASLDEIVGWWILGHIEIDGLASNNWRWYDQGHKPKWYRVLQGLIFILGKHRNTFKDYKIRDVHPVTYWIPWWIQHAMLMQSGTWSIRRVLTLPTFYFWLLSIYIKRSYKKGEYQRGAGSQKNLAWVVLKHLDSPLVDYINHKKHLTDYFKPFSDEHIILEKL